MRAPIIQLAQMPEMKDDRAIAKTFSEVWIKVPAVKTDV